jgi:hypothetical protein
MSETPERRCRRLDSNQLSFACRVYSRGRNESPRPESNRITPRTRRVLDHREAWARSHAEHACGELAARTLRAPESFRPSGRELQRKESNLRDDRLTAGCLTIRLRWNIGLARTCNVHGRTSSCCAKFSESEGRARRACAAWFRAQESNLRFWIQRPASCQLDDPGVTVRGRTSRSGGNRTLTTSIKSRVRLPITLRTQTRAGSPRARGMTHNTWDARESNPHPSG